MEPRGPTEPRGPAGPAGQSAQPGADQLHRVHEAPARGLRASQYVYAIGSYHYNWNTALELLVVVTSALGETDHLIARIATDAGFPDVKAFNTAFRRTFGRTPSAYRRLLTADTAAADESSTNATSPAATRRSCGSCAPGPRAPPAGRSRARRRTCWRAPRRWRRPWSSHAR